MVASIVVSDQLSLLLLRGFFLDDLEVVTHELLHELLVLDLLWVDEVVLVLSTEGDHGVHRTLWTGHITELELTGRELRQQRHCLDSNARVAVRILLVEPHAKDIRLEKHVVERRRTKTKEHDRSTHGPFADNRRGLLANVAKHWHTNRSEEARCHRDSLHETDSACHRRLVHELLLIFISRH